MSLTLFYNLIFTLRNEREDDEWNEGAGDKGAYFRPFVPRVTVKIIGDKKGAL